MQMHITKGAYTDVCKLDEAKQASSTRPAVMLPPVEEEGKQRERTGCQTAAANLVRM